MCLSFPLLGEMIQFDKLFLQFCVGFSTTNYCSPFLGGVKLLLVVTLKKKNEKKNKKTILTAAFFTLFCVGSFQLKERVYSSTLHLGASLLASRFDRGQSQNPDADVAGSATVLILQYVFSIYVLYYIYLNLFCFISIVSYTVQYGFIYRILYLLNVILVYIYIYVYTSYMKLILKMLQKNWRGCTHLYTDMS